MAWDDLKAYVGVEGTAEDTYLTRCWNEAVLLVDQYLGVEGVLYCPATIRDRAYLEVGSELYNRKNAPSGTSQYASFDGGATPVRAPRDPLTMVLPMLNRYVVPF